MTNLPIPLTYSPSLQTAHRPRVVALICGPIALVVAPVSLGLALQVNYGQYDPTALWRLTVAVLACFMVNRRLGSHNPTRDATDDEPVLRIALAVGLAIQFWVLLTTSPMATLVVHSARTLLPFQVGVMAAAICIAVALLPSSGTQRQRRALIGMLSAYFLVGLWVLHVAPPPPVDVCVFQREACNALLHGQNPYAITFALPSDNPARIYAPGTFANGRLLFGYPYPPLSLLLILPGYLLGDFRLSHLAAMTVAGALIALARPSRIATAAAALLLFTPRGFFVLEAGWTEPLAILMLAVVVFTAVRNPRLSPLSLGLLLATKQYLILTAPLAWACNKLRRNWPATVTVVVLVSLPLIVWNLAAFVHSAVLLQFHQPMRMDALSYAPWLFMHAGIRLPSWLPFLAAAVAIAIVIRKRPQSAAAFPAGVAFVFLVFFAFNKQAFCNYYLFVIAAMCCAVALASDDPAAHAGDSRQLR